MASRVAVAASCAAATATCPRSACMLPRRCSCSCCSSCSRPRRARALHAAQALATTKCAASQIVVGRPEAWAGKAPGPSDGSGRRPRALAHARRGPKLAANCTMQNPHITLHIAKHLLLASGQLIERVWHRQTRLDETNKTCREGSPIVTAVASTRLERVPSLSACSVCCAGKLTHAHGRRGSESNRTTATYDDQLPHSSDVQHGSNAIAGPPAP